MAEKDTGRANNNRMLLNQRYEALISAYFSKATGGDIEAAKLVIDVLSKQAKINGLIPKEPLLNINQINPHLLSSSSVIDRLCIMFRNVINHLFWKNRQC